jgi:hypothetical protein
MTVHPIPRSGGPTQPDRSAAHVGGPGEDQPDGLACARWNAYGATVSVLELVDRTLADTTRTANAAKIITTASKGAVKVILSVGVVLAMIIALAGVLIHFAGLGPVLGGAVAAGATTAVAAGRHVRNRRITRRNSGLGAHEARRGLLSRRPQT